jgi:uncharacterized circularly permuted ATP-grasp superfamily protein/uncharacterized alpha-E superfamily protein
LPPTNSSLDTSTPADWDYSPQSGFFDEFASPDGSPRAHWQGFRECFQNMGRGEFDRRWLAAQQIIRNNAITYNVYGDAQGTERLWPLDPIPLILSENEWSWLDQAITQRARLLDGILRDAYGPQQLLTGRKLPPELIFANPHFLRPCHGIPVPGDVRLHFYAVDLARSPEGRWWVVADRTQVPSGSGYALENRIVGARTLPSFFNQHFIRPLNQFFSAQRHGLLSLAKGNRRMVLLTPGPYNETYFEHSFLSKTFAIPLVEGPDLTVRDQRVYLKTLEGLEPVDLILRRQDDNFCDPLELRGDSLLGIPGLLGAVRAGNVVIANALGSGLIETPGSKAFLPGLCRHLLGEELMLPSVATWWCGQETERRYVLDHLDRLIIKPAFPRFGLNPVFGPELDSKSREELRRKIESRPAYYVAQEMVSLSCAPVWTEEGLRPSHIVLRAFAAWDGEKFITLPGGLTRVAQASNSFIVNMQRGGSSKDTWVLGRPEHSLHARLQIDDDEPPHLPQVHATGDLPSRVADNLFWLGRYAERVESMVRTFRAILPVLDGEEDAIHNLSLAAVLELLTGNDLLPRPVLSASIGEQLWQLETLLTGCVNDPSATSKLGQNLKAMRHAAFPLKERLSVDTWRVLQLIEFDGSQPARPFLSKRPASMQLRLDQTITALSAFAGLLSDSTTRGHGWRFLEIGRRLERALQTIELLRYGLGRYPVEPSHMDLVLLIADSSITYRSRYLTALRPNYVLELLLLDESNPRSVAFQLAALVELTGKLPRQDSSSAWSLEKRLAHQPLSAVRVADAPELITPRALEAFLNILVSDLHDLSEALTGRYLSHVMPSRLTSM